MREIKVWGGVHPNEKRALRFVQSLIIDRPPGIYAEIANLEATRLDRRQVGKNLVYALDGDANSPHYEDHRGPEVVKASQGYYAVDDIHNLLSYGDKPTAYVDKKRGISPLHLGFLSRLGVQHIILTEGFGIQAYVDNACGIELTQATLKSSVESAHVRRALHEFANGSQQPTRAVTDFQWYEHTQDLQVEHYPGDLTLTEFPTYFQQFEPLPSKYAATHDFAPDACMIGWAPEFNENGYWAELATPVGVPDTTTWPKE